MPESLTCCGLRVLELQAGGADAFDTGEEALIVLPLAGGCSVACDGERFALAGREDVFSAVSDFVYAPRGASRRRSDMSLRIGVIGAGLMGTTHAGPLSSSVA